ncbi:glycosyltransferase [Sporichthya polymorpha]|uniref:glycosyltransferase n=1 Tax=Sporichthya polymorpha TaxID=35751 RepID=UPI000A0277A0|nr:glycosyltransferase [Sporichthya polymorpha]
MRVAIAQDFLTARAGAERVVLRLLQALPDAYVITSLYDPSRTFPEFAAYDVRPLPLNRVTVLRRDQRFAFPFLASSFARTNVQDADVVLCSSAGWAHGVRTLAPKLVYCHNPPRWLYQPDDYFTDQGIHVRMVYVAMRRYLLKADQEAARSSDRYLANSTSVKNRIHSAYGIEATVVHPPYGVEPQGAQLPVAGLAPGFFLTVARRRGYKNVSQVCQAAATTRAPLVVVGGLPNAAHHWPPNVVGLTDITDAQLRWLYANCSAVVASSFEDFGLSPVEGFAFGKPTLALRAGGYLDSVEEGVTGQFFDRPTADQICRALTNFRSSDYDSSKIREYSDRFSPDTFAENILMHLQAVVGGN